MTTVKVAEQFSKFPAGRYAKDALWSGEAFRDRFLAPALRAGHHITVYMDGTRGYGSSFLEEAFGGLVRIGLLNASTVSKLEIKTEDLSLIEEVYMYIRNAIALYERNNKGESADQQIMG